jgi:hypothetical protein
MAIDGTLLIVTLHAQDVLGYSAVQFGLMTAVLTVMSVIGAYTAQAVVTRTGLRRVGVARMALVGAACLLLTQVSADGSYFEDIFLGLLVFGTGLGAAFVALALPRSALCWRRFCSAREGWSKVPWRALSGSIGSSTS